MMAAWRRTTAGELVAELLGTFVLICFGGDWLIIGPDGRRERLTPFSRRA
jgi:hypothetical protein